jgi:hypothetical protein
MALANAFQVAVEELVRLISKMQGDSAQRNLSAGNVICQ